MTTPTMREERRPVTALFADLVGSTALAEQLDDAEVKLVVGEAVARIVPEVWWEYGKSWSSFADLVVDDPG